MRSVVRSSLLILFLFSVTAHAEEAVTLRQAIRSALDNNNELNAKGWSLKAVESRKSVARSYLLPSVKIEERFSRTNNPTYIFMSKLNQERFAPTDFAVNSLNNPDPVNNYQTVFSFEQPVFAKKAWVALDMANKSLEAEKLGLERFKEKTVLDVFSAYIGVLTASQYREVSEKGLEDARVHLRIAELRYNSGLGLYSDVLRVRVAVLEAEKTIAGTEKELKLAKRMLGLLMGRGEPVGVTGNDFPRIAVGEIDVYLENSLQRRDLKAMEAMYNNALNSVRLAEADFYPVIGVGGSYELNDHVRPLGSEGDSWQIMAFLRINLFDGLRSRSERARAESQVRAAYEYLDGMERLRRA
ncbi:outer membrane channel protein [bacterium BMS3Abin07]|nr:outer membrane channel protein [bacterium BMS3Abin07]GBE32670.1 outer membrane channel protein [bacterium BMS3Bbin05]